MPVPPRGVREEAPPSGGGSAPGRDGARTYVPRPQAGAAGETRAAGGGGDRGRAGAQAWARPRRWASGLFRRAVPAADREVLWLYLVTRAGVWVTAYCARWVFPADAGAHRPASVLAPFGQWDWGYYLHIARDGYFPGGAGPGRPLPGQGAWDNREAFFPGFPVLLRAVHAVVRNWTAAGLLISLVSGAVTVVALARIARLGISGPGRARGGGSRAGRGARRARSGAGARAEASPGTAGAARADASKAPAPHSHDRGREAVLLLLLSPCAVFLAVGYTESLFLAFALPAWLAARGGRWPAAAVLTAAATTVRISGLFLAAAVALHFVLSARGAGAGRRHWRRAPWLALPAVPAAGYAVFLHAHTGDWMDWKHAQERGWYRQFHSPWQSWSHTWTAAFDRGQATGYAFMWQAELLAMVAGLVLLGLLAWRRRWPEALYTGLGLWALGTSYWYMSIPRSTLLWWPLWTALAGLCLRMPRLRAAYLALTAPLTTVFALAFLTGRWAG